MLEKVLRMVEAVLPRARRMLESGSRRGESLDLGSWE
jgi:hypothetical protein